MCLRILTTKAGFIRILASIILLTGFISLGAPPAMGQISSADEGAAWDALWENEFQTAENLFARILEEDDKQASARRGLLMAQVALGRELQVMGTLKKYTDKAPHSPYDFLLLDWLDFSTRMESKEHYELLLNFALKLAESDDLDLIDRRWALATAMKYYGILGKADKVADAAKDLNRLKDFAVLGPFDNTSGSGHRKQHVKTFKYDPALKYSGKYGQPIHWFNPDKVPLTGNFEPTDYFHRTNQTTAYVHTRVHVGEAGPYLLSIGYAGDVDIFINDELFQSCSKDLAGRENRHWILELPAGWIGLGFKISGSEGDGMISCSLSNPDGSRIKDLKCDPRTYGLMPIANLEAQERRGRIFTRIEENAAADSLDYEAVFWNIRRAAVQSSPEAMDQLRESIRNRYPDCALLQLSVLRNSRGRGPSYEGGVARILELAPDLEQALILQAGIDIRKKRFDAAIESMDHVLKISEDSYSALLVKISCLEESQQWEDMKKTALKAAKRFPDEAEPHYALQRYYQNSGSLREQKSARARGHSRLMPGLRLFRGFLEGWEQADFGEARGDIESLTELQPEVSIWWYALLVALITDGEDKKALELNLDCLESFPQDLGLQDYLARFVEAGIVLYDDRYQVIFSPGNSNEMKRFVKNYRGGSSTAIESLLKVEAAAILDRALESEPGNFAIRDRINGLLGRPSFRRALPDPKVSDIVKMRVDASDHPGDDAVVLLSQKRRLVFDNRASLVDQVLAVQILTEDGLQGWENIDLSGGGSNELVVVSSTAIGEDGDQSDGERFRNRVLFPGLSVGDLVILHFQTNDYVSGNLSGFLWDQHVFGFAEEPCLRSTYELIVPEGFEVDAKVWNSAEYCAEGYPFNKPAPGELTRYLWKYLDIPPSKREPFAPSVLAYLPWIDVSNVNDWKTIASWYADIADGQVVVDHRIRTKADELTTGCEGSAAVVSALYDFVANEIRYESIPFYQSGYVPRTSTDVLEDGFGDCKDKVCLLIALLQASGQEGYHFALVTPNAPSSRPYLPSPRFNHAIVAKRTEGGGVSWLDPTFAKGDSRQIPRYLSGTVALVADELSEDLVLIESEPLSNFPYEILTTVSIREDGVGDINRREAFHQVDHVAWVRQAMSDDEPEELKSMQVKKLATRYPGVDVQEVGLVGMEPGQDEVAVRTEFSIPDFGVNDDGIMSLNIPWSSQLSDRFGAIVAEVKRDVPVDLWRLNMCEVDSVVLELPGKTTLQKCPQGVDLSWRGCRYSTEYVMTDSGLQANRMLMIEGKMVNEASYPEFKAWLDEVRRDLGRTHHLRLN